MKKIKQKIKQILGKEKPNTEMGKGLSKADVNDIKSALTEIELIDRQ